MEISIKIPVKKSNTEENRRFIKQIEDEANAAVKSGKDINDVIKHVLDAIKGENNV